MGDVTILIVGSSGAGKTLLVTQQLQGVFPAHYEATIEEEYRCIVTSTDGGVDTTVSIIDVSGDPMFADIRSKWEARANIIILVYSVKHRHSFNDVKAFHAEIEFATAAQSRTPRFVALVGTRVDSSVNREGAVVSSAEGQALANSLGIAIFWEVDCGSRDAVRRLFADLVSMASSQKPTSSVMDDDKIDDDDSSVPSFNVWVIGAAGTGKRTFAAASDANSPLTVQFDDGHELRGDIRIVNTRDTESLETTLTAQSATGAAALVVTYSVGSSESFKFARTFLERIAAKPLRLTKVLVGTHADLPFEQRLVSTSDALSCALQCDVLCFEINSTMPEEVATVLHGVTRGLLTQPRLAVAKSSPLQSRMSILVAKQLTIAICGAAAVGKTCFVLQRLLHRFIPTYEATIEDAYTWNMELKNGTPISANIVDTAGSDAFATLGGRYYDGSDCVILAYSLMDNDSFVKLTALYGDVVSAQKRSQRRAVVVMVGMKMDLCRSPMDTAAVTAHQFARTHSLLHLQVDNTDTNSACRAWALILEHVCLQLSAG